MKTWIITWKREYWIIYASKCDWKMWRPVIRSVDFNLSSHLNGEFPFQFTTRRTIVEARGMAKRCTEEDEFGCDRRPMPRRRWFFSAGLAMAIDRRQLAAAAAGGSGRSTTGRHHLSAPIRHTRRPVNDRRPKQQQQQQQQQQPDWYLISLLPSFFWLLSI